MGEDLQSSRTRTAASPSYSPLRTMRSHWQGDLGVWRVLFYCPLLAMVPVALATGWLMTTGEALSPGRTFVVYAVLLFIPTMGVWWLVGAFRTSLRLLSSNQLAPSALLFILASLGSWQLVVNVIPDAYDTFRSIKQLVADLRQEANENTPWSVEFHPELNRLVASGPIGDHSANALVAAIAQHPNIKILELDSPGGLVSEMHSIVDVVQKHRLDTVVLRQCNSACTDIFLSGERRFVTESSTFGFHQSGYQDRPHDTKWDSAEYTSAIFYRSRGVKEWFFLKSLNTSYYDSWWPSVMDLKDSGFANAWWSDRPAEYR